MKIPSVKSSNKIQLKSKKPKNTCIANPAKTQITPNLNQEEKIRVANRNFSIYKENLCNFSLSQNQNLFILRLSTSPSIPLQFFSMPIYKLLHHTASEMMMNEIELVLWSIYLDRFVWKELRAHLKLMLYMTAFAVKSYMGSQTESFLVYLGFKFNHFSDYFNKWLLNSKPRLATSPKEVNKKFNFLSKRMRTTETKLLNMNFVVDSIIEIAPAHSQDKQVKVKSQSLNLQESNINQIHSCSNININIGEVEGNRVQSDEEIQPPALVVRMDSVFGNPSNILEVHDNESKQKTSSDINNSWTLHNLDTAKEAIEDEPLPHLVSEISYFTYYMSKNNS